MTGELRPSLINLFTQHALQPGHTDVLEIRNHPLPLCVEATNETHSRLTPQWHTQRLHEFAKDRQQLGATMHMMVGVDMGRHAAHQAVELLHLSAEFAAYGRDIT